jgi:hypothetical protein
MFYVMGQVTDIGMENAEMFHVMGQVTEIGTRMLKCLVS